MSEPSRIQLFRPVVKEQAVVEVGNVLRSGWLGTGPRTQAFEEAFAAYVGAEHCVALNSCTTALQLALRVLDLEPGTEVVSSPLTFVSANQVILQEGLVPVFADVQPDTGCVDPASIAERMSERCGALLVMHYGGLPCDLDEIYSLARERGVAVVEDCAHACGAVYRGGRIGSHGDLHAFSFQAVKNLPVGDGGALVVRSPEMAERLRRLRWFGITASTYDRSGGRSYRWDYDVAELGVKGAMNDIEAAVGLVQLGHVDEDNARRATIAARYRDGLSDVDGLSMLRSPGDRTSAHHLFCVLAERRDDLVEHLAAQGIETGVHYRPSYTYRMFPSEPLPGVETFWNSALSLPMHLALSDGDVDRVIETIRAGW